MLPRIFTGILGIGASYTAYNAKTGRISWNEGHSYSKEYYIGEVSDMGDEEGYMSDLYKQPHGKFPMSRVNGGFDGEGSILYLQFLWEQPNPVKIVSQEKTSVVLETMPGHTFQGIARHYCKSINGSLYYCVDGKGVPGESFLKQTSNVLFADIGWPFNLPALPSGGTPEPPEYWS